MKVVAFVPIKMNSRRLPGKNFLPLMGRPLCYHVFSALLDCREIDAVYVYCSDASVTQYVPPKVIFLSRPASLDGDEVKGMEIYRQFVQAIRADVYVLAHATSPFLAQTSLCNALQKVLSAQHDSAFSAKRIQTFCWYNGKPLNYNLDDIPRTQDIGPVFVETSGFYIFNQEVISHNRRIGDHPWIEVVGQTEAIDIDDRDDYEIALRIGGP